MIIIHSFLFFNINFIVNTFNISYFEHNFKLLSSTLISGSKLKINRILVNNVICNK